MSMTEARPLAHVLQEERAARLRSAMAKEGFDRLLVFGNLWRGYCLRYCTGAAMTEGYGVAIVERDGPVRLLAEAPGEAERLAAEHPGLQVAWRPKLFEEIEPILAERGRVSFAPAVAIPFGLANKVDPKRVARATAMFDPLLMCKSPAELEAVRRAAALADQGYMVFMAAARVGRREYELVADVEAFFRERGCPDNFQILASGGIEVRGMHPPGERRLQAGDMVTTELTPCVEGYYAQICRTLVIGEPNAAQKRAFAVFNEAMEAGIDAVKPGGTAADVARALNDVFRAHGLGDYVTSQYTRVRGHALGLGTGLKPSILEDVDTVLEEGMTLIVHPNTFHPETGYFVHGDTLRVTGDGSEVLCGTARALFSVPAH